MHNSAIPTNQFKFNLINAAWAIDLISFVDLIAEFAANPAN